jgi:hypothetical protein
MRVAAATRQQARTRDANGQYNHSLARVCKCGRPKGDHLATRPYPMPDDEGDCERFRLAKAKEGKGGPIKPETLARLLESLASGTTYPHHVAVEITVGAVLKTIDNEDDAQETIRRITDAARRTAERSNTEIAALTVTAENLTDEQRVADVVADVERGPGVTEANVRSNLRSEHGDSSALDLAIASGAVIRSGHKLYARGSVAMPIERATAKHLTDTEIRDYRNSVIGSDHIATYERLMCDTALGAFALGGTKKVINAARRHIAAAVNARREGSK